MIQIKEVLDFLAKNDIEYLFEGDEEFSFKTFCPLKELKENSITWVRNAKDANVSELNEISGLVLVAELKEKIQGASLPVIYVENAHRTYFRVVAHFFESQDPENRHEGIAVTAVVETTDVGEHLFVGHHTYIGSDVKIGCNVSILNNVTIQGKVEIGDYTVIESGATIGVCGFGHYLNEEGKPVCVPHFGGVIIGSNVRIGANSAVARGCLSDTVIEDYVKIDNLCHIAHNVHIKQRAQVIAGSVIGGSTIVGEGVWLAPGSLLNNGINVGENAYFGLGAVAIKDVPGNKVVVGMPVKILRDRE